MDKLACVPSPIGVWHAMTGGKPGGEGAVAALALLCCLFWLGRTLGTHGLLLLPELHLVFGCARRHRHGWQGERGLNSKGGLGHELSSQGSG